MNEATTSYIRGTIAALEQTTPSVETALTFLRSALVDAAAPQCQICDTRERVLVAGACWQCRDEEDEGHGIDYSDSPLTALYAPASA